MKKNFELIAHTADIAIFSRAESIPLLFSYFFEGWKEIVVEISGSEAVQTKLIKIELSADSPEELLVSFISEINFLLEVRSKLCYRINDIAIIESDDVFKLTADIDYVEFNPVLHRLKREIKAVTFHQVNIDFDGKYYSTILVFDI